MAAEEWEIFSIIAEGVVRWIIIGKKQHWEAHPQVTTSLRVEPNAVHIALRSTSLPSFPNHNPPPSTSPSASTFTNNHPYVDFRSFYTNLDFNSVTFHALSTVRRLLFTGYCSPSTIRRLARYLLFTVCCSPSVVHRLLFTVYCSPFHPFTDLIPSLSHPSRT